MAKILDYNATITERRDLMEGLAAFRIRPDDAVVSGEHAEAGFIPGQYLTLGLNRATNDPDDPRPLSVRRPMSIASAPEELPELEFYIRYVDKPESTLPFTHLLWKTKTGDRIHLRPVATGHFTLEGTCGTAPDTLKILVAAGTGLAPFLSIARSRVRKDPKARLDDLAILHGASYPEALGYRDELDALARHNGLRYLPTISRPQAAPWWTGVTGRVEDLFSRERIGETEARLRLAPGELRPSSSAILVCGLNGTIASLIRHLAGRGFVPNHRKLRKLLELDDELPSQLFYEQYDAEPVIDVRDTDLVRELRSRIHAALDRNPG